MAKRISGKEYEASVLRSEKPVLVDYYSEDCLPCKWLSIVLSELEEQFSDKIAFYKVNVNYDAETAEKHEVSAAPTLIFYKGGNEINRIVGLAQRDDIEENLGGLL